VVNGFSVDVEEWFHICGVGGSLAPDYWPTLPARVVETTTRILDLLARCDVRATFFVLGWVAERYPALVTEIQRAGHDVGSHGHTHQRVYELTRTEFGLELSRSRAALAAAGATAIEAFRAPEWSINDRAPWALQMVAAAGFRIDSSMAPMRLVGNPAYPQQPHVRTTPAGTIAELPPFVTRRFGQLMPLGGGWAQRISQPRTVIRAIEARNRAGVPVVLWVHPWELDPDPPRVRLPWPLWVAHYLGLPGFPGRLETILSSARFAPLAELVPAAQAS
jgi:peptidoglycan-N-acetylglucosamine deacetylase